jgi:signal transduction histidine kinase/ActR/RegA family two-component response regulator
MEDAVETGLQFHHKRYTLISKDSQNKIPLEVSVVPLVRPGKPPTVLGVARDISASLKQEEQRQRLEEQLQKLDKVESLRVLAGGIAHDFNNLLVAIIGNAALSRSVLPKDSPSSKYAKRIEKAAQRAAELTDEMLAFAGKGQVTVQPVRVMTLVDDAVRLLQVSLPRNASLDVEHEGPAPAIVADGSQIRRVVTNLISNSCEALLGEPGRILIRTGARNLSRRELANTYLDDKLQPGDYSYISVSDNGCGMTEQTRSRVFEPFFTTKFPGRGLGMAAVLGIVRGHGGAVEVETGEGRGTTVTAYFPSVPFPVKSQRTRSYPSLRLAPREPSTVLLADEQAVVREVAREVLETAGFQVLTANDSIEAVSLFEENASILSVVLLDLLLPQVAGREPHHQMQRIERNVPIIASSGYAQSEAARRFSIDGLAGYIKKPFDPQTLIQTVEKVVGRTLRAS